MTHSQEIREIAAAVLVWCSGALVTVAVCTMTLLPH